MIPGVVILRGRHLGSWASPFFVYGYGSLSHAIGLRKIRNRKACFITIKHEGFRFQFSLKQFR